MSRYQQPDYSRASAQIVSEMMIEFAARTGLRPAGEVQSRYLWTDAFAVCNFLGLYGGTNDETFRKLALLLVDQVHVLLGRHRGDDRRSGWISGLSEDEGRLHPCGGGLRIGKTMNERGPHGPFDDRLEWDRDGQYFHYLTKWMHALCRVSAVTHDPIYRRWAAELAKTAHDAFTYVPFPGGRKRMYWKMSIDLSYPLVPSMGQHDPVDGLITCLEIRAGLMGNSEGLPDLGPEISDMGAICEGKDWTTDDPLGIGCLLSDAFRAAQMIGIETPEYAGLPSALLEASRLGLDAFSKTKSLKAPAERRLAFRELGLSIGLHALERLRGLIKKTPGIFSNQDTVADQVEKLMGYAGLAEDIERFWLEPANREASTFKEHFDINTVMLATSLAPDEYLRV
ncbi:MAG: hypothetical protein ABSE08_10545 [Syntrophobacteraceae bacterium]